MKKVLVTGAGGFIGRRLINSMSDSREHRLVAVISRSSIAGLPNNVSIETADLLDGLSVKGLLERVRPDVCVHLAWDQSNEGYRNAMANYRWMAASVALFQEFIEAGGKQFLFAGTSGEYEAYAGRMRESRAPGPMSLYGRCKKAVSDLLLETAPEYVQIARFFTVYGPGETHLFGAVPNAVRTLLRGERFRCMSPKSIRDYVYIDDAVRAAKKLIESDYRGAVNIGSGIPRTMREVFDEIARQLQCPERVTYDGSESSGAILVADDTGMREILGISEQMPFAEGIARTIAYWRRELEADPYEQL